MGGRRAWVKTILLLTSINLVACSTQTKPVLNPTSRGILAGAAVGAVVGAQAGAPLGAAVGGIAGGLLANYTSEQKTLLQRLQESEVRIVEVGEEVTLILPADAFFLNCSPAIKPRAYPILNDVALLLRTYPKTSVVITGYTDNLGSSARNMALSKQRAQATADYLWSQDVDTRLLYTQGKGEAQALASNNSVKGQRWNRRIEITFQRVSR